ncbi:MAG: Gfo/Idh/MocA family oxidoreductase [Mycobacterium sp.]|nr:Gfo/Idh/MocA family oxidoreductase [Mycobacterium sp.]
MSIKLAVRAEPDGGIGILDSMTLGPAWETAVVEVVCCDRGAHERCWVRGSEQRTSLGAGGRSPVNDQATKVAVIGAGTMANRVHYPSLMAQPDVEIVGICDLDAERLRSTADRYEVDGRFSDYRVMVEETGARVVYAIGQPDAMYNIWCWCLRQGIDLFVEKPLGLTFHQARMLAHLAEQNGCVTQVGFQRRNSPMLQAVMKRVAARGGTVHAICKFYKYDTAARFDARDHMMDDGVHAIDTLRAVCGGELVNIESMTRRLRVPDINFIAAMLEFDSGATGILVNSWTSGRRIFDVEVHAHGLCAELDLEAAGHIYEDGDTAGIALTAQDAAGSDDFFAYGGFLSKTAEFIDCVRTRSQPSSHFGDAVQTMEAAETILAQDLLRTQH